MTLPLEPGSAPASKLRVSVALWIPVIWLSIAGSRPVTAWFNAAADDLTDRNIDGSPVDRTIFTVLILAALIVLSQRRKVRALLKANAPLLLFFAYCAVSIVWSDFGDQALKRWIRAVGDLSMVLVVLTDEYPLEAVERFLQRTSVILLPASIAFDFWRGAAGRAYQFGLTQNKNMYGGISMILGIAALWRLLTILQKEDRKLRRRQLMVQGALLSMATICVWASNSATSIGCFGLGSLILILTGRMSFVRKPAVAYFLIALFVFMALYSAILNPQVGVVSSMGKDPTLTGRTDIWPVVIPMNPNALLGAGFESFWMGERLKYLWTIFPWRPNEAHNGYIEVYLNLGWMGIVLLGGILVTAFRKTVKALRQNVGPAQLGLAYLTVVVVYNLTEAGFRIFSPVWIIFLLAAVGQVKSQRPALVSTPVETPSWDSAEVGAAVSGLQTFHDR